MPDPPPLRQVAVAIEDDRAAKQSRARRQVGRTLGSRPPRVFTVLSPGMPATRRARVHAQDRVERSGLVREHRFLLYREECSLTSCIAVERRMS